MYGVETCMTLYVGNKWAICSLPIGWPFPPLIHDPNVADYEARGYTIVYV
jgi:hypothetical protein